VHKDILYRQAYPNTAPGLIGANDKAAIDAPGADDFDTRFWWDVD